MQFTTVLLGDFPMPRWSLIVDDEAVPFVPPYPTVQWGLPLSYHDCFMSAWVNDDPSLQVYNAWHRRPECNGRSFRGPCFWLLFCHDNLLANSSSLGFPGGRVFGMPQILMELELGVMRFAFVSCSETLALCSGCGGRWLCLMQGLHWLCSSCCDAVGVFTEPILLKLMVLILGTAVVYC
ncbi:hypothetical protein Nepgr_032590 [Nepenthes gracilis]|uniref:Uncharacterized protein n=1 Tax=Nepenthes gracilis TaxID=150966 RepID=A0AAD3Y5V9_NEPGR|nr:hypothetical protein Nepgr_032590 [Nepenthes gracilis]